MPDLLEQGAAWLEDQRTRHMSRMVTYLRGSDSVDLAATIGRTEFEQADEYGIVHRTESRDFLVLAADLVLAGKAELPRAGDRIRETVGDQIFIYEVMAPSGEPPWRYSDPYRRTLRIHTKHVDMERA
ncbi:MAG: hypothetical protein KKB50_10700 [Planctomycetes bacterium]|nr:hypothetical protein [Planctomycetota bacterium]